MMHLKNEIQTNALLLPKGCFSRKYNGILSRDRWLGSLEAHSTVQAAQQRRRRRVAQRGHPSSKGLRLVVVVLVLA